MKKATQEWEEEERDREEEEREQEREQESCAPLRRGFSLTHPRHRPSVAGLNPNRRR